MREGYRKDNPFALASPQKELSIPKFLYAEELEELFEVSDTETPLGQRNQALLELMYATGIRVSECVNLQLTDIDFAVGTILVMGKGKTKVYSVRELCTRCFNYLYREREKTVSQEN